MALTDTQKSQIRRLLGYPERFHQTQPELEQALQAIENIPTGEAEVVGLLNKALTLETSIEAARNRLKASQVGSIVLNPSEIPMLKSEGNRLLRQMGAILGCPVVASAFGGIISSNRLEMG